MAAEYSDMSVESESLTDDFDYLANLLDSADVEMYLEDVEEEIKDEEHLCVVCGKSCKTERGLKLHNKIHLFTKYEINDEKVKIFVEKTCTKIEEEKLYGDQVLEGIKSIQEYSKENDLSDLCEAFNTIKFKSKEHFLSEAYFIILTKHSDFFSNDIENRVKKIFLMKFINVYMSEMEKSAIPEQINVKVLNEKEIAGLQYLGGYVLFNLNKKYRNSKKFKTDFFQQMLAIFECCKEKNQHKNYRLVNAINRGGLWVVSEDIQKIFMIAEKYFCVNTASKYLTKIKVENFVSKIQYHPYVQEVFSKIIDLVDKEIDQEIKDLSLAAIIKLYLNVRSFSYAKSKVQIVNQQNRNKFKSLRKEIAKSTKET